MAYATTAEWVAAQPTEAYLNTLPNAAERSKVFQAWQMQRPGYANPLDYQTYDQYAMAANPRNKEFNTGSGQEIQNQANFYGMTVENYLNALSGDPTKPMGQYQSVYGSQLLSPIQQVAAQTARGQGIGEMTPQTLALAQANPSVFNEAARKYRENFISKYPGSLEYEGLFAGPQQFSATGVKQPTASQANSMYVLDPATNTIVRNPNYTANFAMDQGTSRTGAPTSMAAAAVASRPANIQKIFDLVVANPSITDREIVSSMKQLNVSPKDIAELFDLSEGQVISRVAATVPNGETITLGDTIIQPVYQVTGLGDSEQIGGLQNVITYKATDNKAGGAYTQYTPTGEVEKTGTQQEVKSGLKEFALGAALLFGLPTLLNAGAATGAAATAGTTGSLTAGLTAAETAASAAATGLTTTQVANLVKAGLTTAQIANLFSAGTTTAAGLLQQQTSKEAADKARAMIDTETAAAKASAGFRPVGMTTRFGTSQFQTDPVTGQLTSAGYTLSPEAKAAQDRFVTLAGQGITQAEQAQQQFAPLQTGAQNLFNLGNQYIAQSPEAVAQNYLNQQMSLLQPGRELELANLQNRLQQQGRGGLAVAQGGALGATTPELQALYNARATQEAQLAANAQQYGQQQVAFGAGLLGQGSQAMGQFYGGQQAAYAPYTTALGQVQGLEQLAQQPLQMGAQLGQTAATAGANVGRLGLTGAGQSVELATGRAATTNPYSTLLSGVAANPAFSNLVGSTFGSTPATSGFSYGKYGTGVDPSTGEYFGSLYF